MKEILEKFLEFEKENNLLDLQIDGIYFWVIVRRRISDNILNDLQIISQSDFTVASGFSQQIHDMVQYGWHAFLNLFKTIPKVEAILINHPRKILVDGKYIDIYTHYLEEDYKMKQIPFLTIDVPYNWHIHLLKKTSNIRNMENFSVVKKVYCRYFHKNNLLKNSILLDISKKLKVLFQTDGNLFSTVYAQLNTYKQDYKYSTKLLKKAQPKTISIVISEVYPGIVQAAKDLNIETLEIQHGLIGKQHLAYEYPDREQVPYFPDKIRLFGKFWYDICDIPLPYDKVILTENTYLSEKRKLRIAKKEQILFISQGWITTKMIAIMKDFIKLTPKLKIVFKLHPSEYEVWKTEYPELFELANQDLITVVDSFDKSIYDWLGESKYVVGVSSTCLYEALFFNCEVYLLDLPTIDLMDPLIDAHVLTVSKNANELLENMHSPNVNHKINLNDIYYQKEETK